MLVSYNVNGTCTHVIYFCWRSQLPLKPTGTAQLVVNEGKHATKTVIFVAFFLFCFYIKFTQLSGKSRRITNALHASTALQNV